MQHARQCQRGARLAYLLQLRGNIPSFIHISDGKMARGHIDFDRSSRLHEAGSFFVTRAIAIGGTVVTMEKPRPNAVKIPDIRQHFEIPVLDLEGFMVKEGWEF